MDEKNQQGKPKYAQKALLHHSIDALRSIKDNMKKRIALFDWDGTIRKGFTIKEWGEFLEKKIWRKARINN